MEEMYELCTIISQSGISQRRVAILCKEGRVPGAELIGNRWFLPVDAMKPEDPRKARKNEQ